MVNNILNMQLNNKKEVKNPIVRIYNFGSFVNYSANPCPHSTSTKGENKKIE
jgi:hypothetical protein